MNIKENFVSVIVPVFNSQEFIEKTLFSILNQNFTNFEIVVIDDGSTDDTKSILEYFKSCGEYIAFCDSDDIWEYNKLSSQIKFLKENGGYFTCSAYNYINTSDEIISKFYPKDHIDYFGLLKTCDIGTSTVLYNRKYLGVLLMPDLRMKQDYLTWLALLKDIKCVNSMPVILASIRKHSKSNSFSKFKAFKYQFLALGIHLNCSLLNIKRILYFLNYVYFGIRKHYLFNI
jgi:teichuronic acid biosynthesis glycosyltransferase TuaG